MRWVVELHGEHERGFRASVPDLPGCIAESDTVCEAEMDIAAAIEARLAHERRAGRFPMPRAQLAERIARGTAPDCMWLVIEAHAPPLNSPCTEPRCLAPEAQDGMPSASAAPCPHFVPRCSPTT